MLQFLQILPCLFFSDVAALDVHTGSTMLCVGADAVSQTTDTFQRKSGKYRGRYPVKVTRAGQDFLVRYFNDKRRTVPFSDFAVEIHSFHEINRRIDVTRELAKMISLRCSHFAGVNASLLRVKYQAPNFWCLVGFRNVHTIIV